MTLLIYSVPNMEKQGIVAKWEDRRLAHTITTKTEIRASKSRSHHLLELCDHCFQLCQQVLHLNILAVPVNGLNKGSQN